MICQLRLFPERKLLKLNQYPKKNDEVGEDLERIEYMTLAVVVEFLQILIFYKYFVIVYEIIPFLFWYNNDQYVDRLKVR